MLFSLGVMSRSNAASQKANMNPSKLSRSQKAKGLKDIRVDEEVKIAVNIALERFQYSDQRGVFGLNGTENTIRNLQFCMSLLL